MPTKWTDISILDLIKFQLKATVALIAVALLLCIPAALVAVAHELLTKSGQ